MFVRVRVCVCVWECVGDDIACYSSCERNLPPAQGRQASKSKRRGDQGGPRAVSRETVNKSPLEFQLTSQLFLLLRFGPYCRSESEIGGSASALSSSSSPFKTRHLKRRIVVGVSRSQRRHLRVKIIKITLRISHGVFNI